MILSLNQLIRSTALTCLLIAHSIAAEPTCPARPFTPAPAVLVAQGYGFKSIEAERNARIELAQMLHGVKVAAEYQQMLTGTNTTVSQQAHLASMGRVSGRHIHHTLKCDKGFVSYLFYDPRSLEQQLAALLTQGRYVLTGPNYLITSDLLKPYQSKDGEVLPVQLIVTEEESLLQLGAERIVVPKSRVHELITLSTPEHAKSATGFFINSDKTHLDGYQRATLSIQASQPSILFMCQLRGCQILKSVPSGKQRLELVNPQTGALNTVFIALASHSALATPSLSTLTAQTPGYFQKLLALQHRQQGELVVIPLKVAGNF